MGSVQGEDTEEMKRMLMKMMKMMDNVEGKMGWVEKGMEEVQATAGRAVHMAEWAKRAVEDMRAEIKREVGRIDENVDNAVFSGGGSFGRVGSTAIRNV